MRFTSLVAAVALLAGVAPVWAQSGGHAKSVDDVVAKIRGELRLGANDRIDPDKVPVALLEDLGDAVMDTMVAGAKQHEWMDRMMGGEGSDSLAAAHRWMGYRYLTGGYGGAMAMMGAPGGGGPGMMMGSAGPGMTMGPQTTGRGGMMGDRSVPYDRVPYQSPEDIAKRRYAQGEITREQYMQLMEDLTK